MVEPRSSIWGLQPLRRTIGLYKIIGVRANLYLKNVSSMRALSQQRAVVNSVVGWVGFMIDRLAGQWELGGFGSDLDAVVETWTSGLLTIRADWLFCLLSGDHASAGQVVIDFAKQFQPRVQPGMLGKNSALPMGSSSVLLRSSQ
ncbi:MAG: hypothetical protein HKL84_11035 [Acidimicrobiaceae bacterium]|nr:hypothetical protein [Acidimicrobiaceae bacterium]